MSADERAALNTPSLIFIIGQLLLCLRGQGESMVVASILEYDTAMVFNGSHPAFSQPPSSFHFFHQPAIGELKTVSISTCPRAPLTLGHTFVIARAFICLHLPAQKQHRSFCLQNVAILSSRHQQHFLRNPAACFLCRVLPCICSDSTSVLSLRNDAGISPPCPGLNGPTGGGEGDG
jgi:hypothetical protein